MVKADEWIFALVGDKGVGKAQFCKSIQEHIPSYEGRSPKELQEDPTFKPKFRRKFIVDKKLALLELDASNIWSLDNSLDSETLAEQMTPMLEKTRCFLLIYNTSSEDSFTRIKPYYDFIREVYTKQPKDAAQLHTLPRLEPRFFLIGIKPNAPVKTEVLPASGEELAVKLHGCLGFVECSFKDDLSEIVLGLVRILRDDAVSSKHKTSDRRFTLGSVIPWVRKMFRRPR